MQSDLCSLALESARIGLWDFDPSSGQYFGDRRCRKLFGVGEGESIDLDEALEIIHAADRERVGSSILAALNPSSDGRYESEYRVVWPNGELHWLYARGQAHFEGKGEQRRLWRFTGILMDLTDRKQTEEQLLEAKRGAEDANRAKSEFLATMSHEIRTPMTVIMGTVEQMLLDEQDPNHRHLLEMAEHSANRMLRIINDLLDIARIEARSLELDEGPFEIRAWLQETIRMVAEPARIKQVEIAWQVAPQVPALVFADAARLGQILLNLVGNAVKFTPAGRVEITVAPRGEELLFSVHDTGIGIPREKLQMIFESFRQVNGGQTQRGGGAGLGLAISRGLVELMGGAIWVESEPGQGSTFFFSLPLRPVEETAAGKAGPNDSSTF